MNNLYKFFVVLGFILTVPFFHLFAQVGINADNSAPDASAGLDVKFSNKGVLLPRMTRVQRNAIPTPAEGLMVYCTNCGQNGSLSIFINGSWMTVASCAVAAPIAGSPVMSQGQIIWNWLAVSGAAGYKWNTTADYETAIDMGTAITKTETGTVCGITYTRYVWAYSSCGESSMTTLTATVPAEVPAAPVAASHVATQTSITWNWNTVAGAIGYKWNSVDDYATATEMGTSTTKSETGILCGTAYNRYTWSYNGCGHSVSAALTQSTLACCGIYTITVNHLASGGVAPVDKTVTYGTATNIPGELTKCWITRNLGAAQQATVVSDATEASAGWYWQFNRKQGYKHDGTTRTPGTAWDASNDNLSTTWEAAKDPCAFELGTGWRVPTYTEWANVNTGGGWTNWNGPFGSALKLHAAGLLDTSDGSLGNRGSVGYYWSSAQNSAAYGWYLFFYSSSSGMYNYGKSYGFSVRCVRDF